MSNEEKRIQYRTAIYIDDQGKGWSVTIRKRVYVLGGFDDIGPGNMPAGAIFSWGWQNLDMRHVTVKTNDGKILKFPCMRETSDLFNAVGQVVQVPIWDTGIDDGEAPSVEVAATVISRKSENPGRGSYRSPYIITQSV